VAHTNLGRSVLPDDALAALQTAGAGYSDLELDLAGGERASRQDHVNDVLRQLTGAEAALVVNNNAAAVLLALAATSRGGDVLVARGQLVEIGDSSEIAFHSVHPYTKSLVSAIPIADPNTSRVRKRIVLEGDVPSPVNPPSGCRFRTRCPYATELCAKEEPEFREVGAGHFAACHHINKIADKSAGNAADKVN
jgi:oligopeptide/dipeptide ABC transporter ATP-binding protein